MYHFRRNLFTISNLLLLLWLASLGVSQPAEAQDSITAKVESRRVVDICGKKNDQVVVVINLGKIVRQDSLFGCNFQLSYDSTKLKFHSALYLNTLAEFFDFKQVGFFKSGKIIGAVATLGMSPIFGDRPLIGFLGNYTGECADSIEIKIDYLEFTFEFKKIVGYQNGLVEGIVADFPNRSITLKTNSDSTIIDSLNTNCRIGLIAETGNDSTVQILESKLLFRNFNNYTLTDIVSKDTNLVKIEKNRIADDSADITFFVNGRINKQEIAEIAIAEKRKGEEVAEISIVPYKTDDCSCISRYLATNHYVRSERKQDDTTGTGYPDEIGQEIVERFNSGTYEWEIESRDDIEITVYDMLGNVIFVRKSISGISRISLDRFSNGVYFGIIKTKEQRILKKILIKN